MHISQEAELIILVGPPNSGKTTIFNWLTGSRFKTVNYPGSTVECYLGQTHARYGAALEVLDTPGTYSLIAKSPDEEVTADALWGPRYRERTRGLVVCVDATQLDRHLYLVAQLKAAGWPFVVALTMTDLSRSNGHQLDLKRIESELGVKVVAIDGLLGGGIAELVQAMQELAHGYSSGGTLQKLTAWDPEKVAREMAAAATLARQITKASPANWSRQARRATEQIDRILLHSTWGVISFLAIMVILFSAIFWAADPMMGAIDSAFAWAGDQVHNGLGDGLWANFLADGLLASFGALWVFVPQIFILFLGLGLLEDSGYLARAATIVDRPLAAVGLSGRAFVPLLSGYACAVPAILAARTIRSTRERWIAIFIIPFTSCSARLPVYALLLTFLFPMGPAWRPGLALAVIYLGSLVVGGLAAGVLNRIVKLKKDSVFMMELPIFRRPLLRVVVRSAVLRTRHYVVRAGPVIFGLALILWLATHFPRAEESSSASQQIAQSYAGQAGRFIEPVFRPMGVDWRVGVGLLSAFAAREVFVSSMTLVFDVANADQNEDSLRGSLLEKMRQATFEGRPLFTVSTVVGLILFFMLALQCTSTSAIAKAEMQSTRFAVLQVVTLNVLAYLVAVGAVQGLRALGIA